MSTTVMACDDLRAIGGLDAPYSPVGSAGPDAVDAPKARSATVR
jgi:hypothetical protein